MRHFLTLPLIVAVTAAALPAHGTDKKTTKMDNQVTARFYEALQKTQFADDEACKAAAAKLADNNKQPSVFERKAILDFIDQCLDRKRATELEAIRGGSAVEALATVNARLAPDESIVALDQEISQADRKFQGLSWGVGFGVSHSFDDVITEATLVNGVVRSSKDETQKARILLEAHRYFWCSRTERAARIGCGPAGIIATGQEDVLAGVGFGFMFGWKAPDPTKGGGFSLGLGVLLDNDVKSLAGGIDQDEPLPAGETEIRFESEARWSAVLFFTRTF